MMTHYPGPHVDMRAHFAAQAMLAMLGDGHTLRTLFDEDVARYTSSIAELAWRMADAMMDSPLRIP